MGRILSANVYNPNTCPVAKLYGVGGEEKEHRDPKVILKEIELTNKEVDKARKKIRTLLE